jgi:hypothetical protein
MKITSGPIANFVIALLSAITDIKESDFEQYTKVDEDEILLLMNNGCRISDVEPMENMVSLDNNYYVSIITGMMGNDKNTFFDFYYTHDGNRNVIKILVVFLDYFKDVKTEETPLVDENGITDITGNSNFFFAIKQISEIFLMSYYNPATFTGAFNATVAGTNFRYLPNIIAGIILAQFKPLTEEDTEGCGMEHNMLTEILQDESMPINLILSGIRRQDR